MRAWVTAASVVVCIAAHEIARAQNAALSESSLPASAVALVDSTGKPAARPLSNTIMLMTVRSGVVAPALIRPIYDADGRVASGLATWQTGGSVLFTSSDCTGDGYIYTLPYAGLRATTQVQTDAGIVLYAGAIGTATTVAIRSILYDTGCSPVTVRQNGLVPVVATINLSTAHPPPLSLQ